MPNELLPCPFCGSDKIGIWPTGVLFPNCKKGFAVMCDSCNAGGHWNTDEETARERWNRRAHSPAVRDLLSAARMTANLICQTWVYQPLIDAIATVEKESQCQP